MNKGYIYKRRLLQLVDVLRKLPVKRFNYSTWVGKDWGGAPDLSCGTTACALGWATTIPALRRAGLRLGKIPNDDDFQPFAPHMVGDTPSYDSSEYVAAEVFGLSFDEYAYLFIPGSDVPDEYAGILEDNGPGDNASAKKVAMHIKNFVETKYGK